MACDGICSHRNWAGRRRSSCQSKRGRIGPSAPDAAWTPAHPSDRWECIVIHHSGSDEGEPNASTNGTSAGWEGLGYHFVIGNGTDTQDGQVEVGYRWTRQEHGAPLQNRRRILQPARHRHLPGRQLRSNVPPPPKCAAWCGCAGFSADSFTCPLPRSTPTAESPGKPTAPGRTSTSMNSAKRFADRHSRWGRGRSFKFHCRHNSSGSRWLMKSANLISNAAVCRSRRVLRELSTNCRGCRRTYLRFGSSVRRRRRGQSRQGPLRQSAGRFQPRGVEARRSSSRA